MAGATGLARATTRGRRAQGDLERLVLRCLWQADVPLATSAVRDAIGGELAYTTVATVLARLEAKGLVVRSRAHRGYAYAAARSGAEVAASQMARALDDATDRTAALARFAAGLAPDDRATLRLLL